MFPNAELSFYLQGSRPAPNGGAFPELLLLPSDIPRSRLGLLRVLGRQPGGTRERYDALVLHWGDVKDLSRILSPVSASRISGFGRHAWIIGWKGYNAEQRALLGRALEQARRWLDVTHQITQIGVTLPPTPSDNLSAPEEEAFWTGAGFIAHPVNREANGSPIYLHPGIDASVG